VPAEPKLRKNQVAVDADLERAAGALNELDGRFGINLANLSRQTGGSRFVVSDDAVLNSDLHHGSSRVPSTS